MLMNMDFAVLNLNNNRWSKTIIASPLTMYVAYPYEWEINDMETNGDIWINCFHCSLCLCSFPTITSLKRSINMRLISYYMSYNETILHHSCFNVWKGKVLEMKLPRYVVALVVNSVSTAGLRLAKLHRENF